MRTAFATQPIASRRFGTKHRRALAVCVGVCVLTAVGLGVWLLGAGRSDARHATKRVAASSVPSKAAKAGVAMAFPASAGVTPKSLTIEYDAKKDRTRMSLGLRGFASVASSVGPARGVSLELVSQFKGQARPADYAELSVECTARAVSAQAGVLAPSSPPGEVRANGKAYALKASSQSNAGYRSKPAGDGVHETLAFKLATRDLIEIVGASDVQMTIGALQVTLTRSQVGELREFAARMRPGG